MASGTMQQLQQEVLSLGKVKTVTTKYEIPAGGTITIPVTYRSAYFIYSLTNAGIGFSVIVSANSSAEVLHIKTPSNYTVTASGLNISVKDNTSYGRSIYVTKIADRVD